MKKIKAYFFNVPFRIFGLWDFDKTIISKPLKEKGIETGCIPYNTKINEYVCLFRNEKYEFIYKVINYNYLKGSDFLYQTDKTFDLEFYKRIKRRNYE